MAATASQDKRLVTPGFGDGARLVEDVAGVLLADMLALCRDESFAVGAVNLATIENRLAVTEDKVDVALDIAVGKYCRAGRQVRASPVPAQPRCLRRACPGCPSKRTLRKTARSPSPAEPPPASLPERLSCVLKSFWNVMFSATEIVARHIDRCSMRCARRWCSRYGRKPRRLARILIRASQFNVAPVDGQHFTIRSGSSSTRAPFAGAISIARWME